MLQERIAVNSIHLVDNTNFWLAILILVHRASYLNAGSVAVNRKTGRRQRSLPPGQFVIQVTRKSWFGFPGDPSG